MPWSVRKSAECPESKPWAVIKDSDGSTVACHESEEAAQAQMAALYASESGRGSPDDLTASTWGIQVRDALTLPTAGELAARIGPVRIPLTPAVHKREVVDAVFNEGTVETLLVPWDSPTWVADDLPNGKQEIYQEGFRSSAFDEQFGDIVKMRSMAPRVMFRHMHSRADGFGPLGIGRRFEVRPEGLWGEFHIIERERRTFAELVENGIEKLSIEFRERPDGVDPADGIVWRTGAHLFGVALEMAGAYPEAQVLAMRSAMEGAEQERAEREQAERAERERAEAEARIAEAQAASDKAELDAAVARHRRTEEMREWLAEQEREQARFAARYG